MRHPGPGYGTALPYAPTLWIVRIAIALMFIESAVDKVLHWGHYLVETVTVGIPMPVVALGAAVLIEICGSLALLTGILVLPFLSALAFYTAAVNVFYFDFWTMTGPDAAMALKNFLKNIAVSGGIIAVLLHLTVRPDGA